MGEGRCAADFGLNFSNLGLILRNLSDVVDCVIVSFFIVFFFLYLRMMHLTQGSFENNLSTSMGSCKVYVYSTSPDPA